METSRLFQFCGNNVLLVKQNSREREEETWSKLCVTRAFTAAEKETEMFFVRYLLNMKYCLKLCEPVQFFCFSRQANDFGKNCILMIKLSL